MNVQKVKFNNLQVIPFICGPIANNVYALIDSESNDCVVIDPSFYFDRVLQQLKKLGYQPREYWLTHGHYDHYNGLGYPASRALGISAHMHPADRILFDEGINQMGQTIPYIIDSPTPIMDLADGKVLRVGSYSFKVLHTPGHAPGHCCFYCAQAGWLFSGDLVFYHDYGRTDLTGGSEAALLKSIREEVLTLPDETLIMPGHEDYTFVKDERARY